MDDEQARDAAMAADEQVSGAQLRGDELREASFPQALRGYDREAVHAFLDRVADWVEGKAGAAAQAAPEVRDELEKVGERTAGILTAAEEAAANLRADAEEHARQLRTRAEEETRKARLNASQRADELITEAETKAEKIIDDAIARRRSLNQAITSLAQRKDEIAGEAQRLADELLEAVDALRSGETAEEAGEALAEEPVDEAPEPVDEPIEEPVDEPRGSGRFDPTPAAEETELEPPDQRETAIHDTR
jgi:DivIVA domain-containing protein